MQNESKVLNKLEPHLFKKANPILQKIKTGWFVVLLFSRMVLGTVKIFLKLIFTPGTKNTKKGGGPL